MDVLLSAMAALAKAQTSAMARGGGSHLETLAGAPSALDGPVSRIPGARGAAVQEMYRQFFAASVGAFSTQAHQNLRPARQAQTAEWGPRLESAREIGRVLAPP